MYAAPFQIGTGGSAGPDSSQDLSCLLHVEVDLGLQVADGLVLDLVPQASDELEGYLLAVEVAVEVQDERLYRAVALLEGWARPMLVAAMKEPRPMETQAA